VKKYLIAISLVIVFAAGISRTQVVQTFASLAAANIFTAAVNTFNEVVTTNVVDSALTSGNCVQASTGGILITTSNPCALSYTLPTQYTKLRCETGLGDGLNAMAAGTYLQSFCFNDSGVTWTITGIKCYVDGGSSSTLNASGNTLGSLLTGAISCSTSFASGTQTANVLLTSGDYIKFTFVADGTAKQSSWVVSMSQ
jgi:hypothetical protein